MSYIDAFNKQLLNLLKEISKQYPDNLDLKALKNTLFIIIKASPKKPINVYHESVYIYHNQIMNEDSDFFLNFDLKNTLLEDFGYVKNVWENSNDKNKKIIWTYFKVFDKLVEKHYKNL